MSPSWKKYQGKILRRCDLCGKFHASYRVEDPRLGSLILCQNCWSRRAASQSPAETAPQKIPSDAKPEQS
jgi:hypothetical protein